MQETKSWYFAIRPKCFIKNEQEKPEKIRVALSEKPKNAVNVTDTSIQFS